MLKLALLGRNISHSKSKDMYQEILGKEVDYTLLDCDDESEIPELEKILNTYEGLSITAPYKKHFFNDVTVDSEVVRSLGIINCIGLRGNRPVGTNTDFTAVTELMKKLVEKDFKKVLILGDGSMSKMTQKICDLQGVSYKVVSRKNYGDISSFDTTACFDTSSDRPFVINSCSRDFIFRGKVDQNTLFWDYNYSFEPHKEFYSDKCEYVDGLELLKLQARHALLFWEIIPA